MQLSSNISFKRAHYSFSLQCSSQGLLHSSVSFQQIQVLWHWFFHVVKSCNGGAYDLKPAIHNKATKLLAYLVCMYVLASLDHTAIFTGCYHFAGSHPVSVILWEQAQQLVWQVRKMPDQLSAVTAKIADQLAKYY